MLNELKSAHDKGYCNAILTKDFSSKCHVEDLLLLSSSLCFLPTDGFISLVCPTKNCNGNRV